MTDNLANGRVIVTYGRSLMALTVAHSLAARGVEVIGCDDIDFTVLSFSRQVTKHFVHKPADKDLGAYLDSLEGHVRKHKPEDGRPYVLMPVFSDTRLLAQHRGRFDGLITIAAAPYEAIEKVDPKDRLVETARTMGIRTPLTARFTTRAELEAATREIGFPCLIKPVDMVGGRGVRKFTALEPMLAYWDEAAERYEGRALLQQSVGGDDYCLTALFENGALKAHMAYRNLSQFPSRTGAGVVRETIPDAPFLPAAEALLGALNWNGVAEMDFRWDGNPESEPWLIEVNPRFWAGLFHSVESGVDFPWLAYVLAVTGKAPAGAPAEIGSKSKAPGLWLVSAIEDIARSDIDFGKVEEAWGEAMGRIRDRQVLEGLKMAGASFGKVFDANEAAHRLKLARRHAAGADSEIVLRDDPLISLGALFVLGSLIRHRRLPPEVTRK
jgi:predicted ATP-grasp superfamily ATP-dependent carboligase